MPSVPVAPKTQPILKTKAQSVNESLTNKLTDFVKGKRLIDPVTGRTEDEKVDDLINNESGINSTRQHQNPLNIEVQLEDYQK